MRTHTHVQGTPQQASRRPRKVWPVPSRRRRGVENTTADPKTVGVRKKNSARIRFGDHLRKARPDVKWLTVDLKDMSPRGWASLRRCALHLECSESTFVEAI